MRAPSKSIQHSSTPALSAGARLGTCRVETSRPAAITANSSHSESSRNPDNFSRSTGLYLNEHRLCSLHLGSSGSPFLNCHLEQLVMLSGVTASRQRSCYAVEGSLPSHIPARTPRHFAGRLPLNQARPDPHAATFRFFRNSFFSTRIPLSTCFSSSKNGGKNLTTVSCVELKSTPSAKAASTIGRAGISRLIP